MESKTEEDSPSSYVIEAARSSPPTFMERYFKTFIYTYRRNSNDESLCEDILIAQHSNELYVIFLADSHSLVQREQVVTQVKPVKWDPTAVHGKRKKGGRMVQPRTVICSIMTQSGTEYLVPAGVHGSLVEWNWRLPQKPSLLLDKRQTKGYIAVILPKKNVSKTSSKLRSEATLP